MKTFDRRATAGVLALAVCLSLLSAMPNSLQARPLPQAVEAQAVGGNNQCAAAWGLGLGLAAASLSPCGVVCLSLAWYNLALIGAYCE